MTAPDTVDLLVVGHVARDFIAGQERVGGAASFAALAAARLGLRVGLVTATAPGDDILDSIRAIPEIAVHTAASAATTTFELDYSGPQRTVRLLARADDLSFDDVPLAWRDAPLVYGAPVIGECSGELLAALGSDRVVVGAQGWLRSVDATGRVVPALKPEAVQPPPGLLAVVFSELDHPDADRLAERFAETTRVVAVTRGARGATIYAGDARHEVEPAPAVEVDPTGAGDVFGLALGVGCQRGDAPLDAARWAASLAARVVEGPGLGRLTAAAAGRSPISAAG